MSTITSSAPELLIDGFGTGMPRLAISATTNVSSAILPTGFWSRAGNGSRNLSGCGLRVGDLLIHIASTDSATPGRATLHGVLSSTINQATTSASSAFNYGFDLTVASAT